MRTSQEESDSGSSHNLEACKREREYLYMWAMMISAGHMIGKSSPRCYTTIIDYLKQSVVFYDPVYKFSTVKVPKAYQICYRWSVGQAYCAWILVCRQVLYTAFPLLMLWNASIINPFLLALRPSNVACMALISQELSATLTASSLQQILAWHHRLLVDLALLLSRNQWMKHVLQPHVGAVHLKTWDLWPQMYSMVGRGLKNA